MRYLILVLPLICLFTFHSSPYASTGSKVFQNALVVEKRTIVITRPARLLKGLPPSRKKAKISYPVIVSGIEDVAVLAKVRQLLSFQNIFETSIQEYRQDTWLDELNYRVNYNMNSIFDITFRQEGVGAYPDSQEKHLAINLKSGELIKATDVFKPDALENLATMLNEKLQAEIKETIKEVNKDKSIDADQKSSMSELLENLKIGVEDLDNFLIDDKGITFLYDAGFPHAVQAYQPDGRYRYSYSELGPYFIREGAPQTLVR